jgi:hypothetical protein
MATLTRNFSGQVCQAIPLSVCEVNKLSPASDLGIESSSVN